jgi:hypothetical protein
LVMEAGIKAAQLLAVSHPGLSLIALQHSWFVCGCDQPAPSSFWETGCMPAMPVCWFKDATSASQTERIAQPHAPLALCTSAGRQHPYQAVVHD